MTLTFLSTFTEHGTGNGKFWWFTSMSSLTWGEEYGYVFSSIVDSILILRVLWYKTHVFTATQNTRPPSLKTG